MFSTGLTYLLCYITNHLMNGPLRNSEFCFPQISMFPSTLCWETLRFSGNKIHCSPRDQSLSVYYITFSYPRQLVYNTIRLVGPNKQLKQMIQNEHNIVKNPCNTSIFIPVYLVSSSQNSHYCGNSDVFSFINKDFILPQF